jgi:SAM-dependent methyltransferase
LLIYLSAIPWRTRRFLGGLAVISNESLHNRTAPFVGGFMHLVSMNFPDPFFYWGNTVVAMRHLACQVPITMSAISPTPLSGPSFPTTNEEPTWSLGRVDTSGLVGISVRTRPNGLLMRLALGMARRWRRELRRRQVGRAYDMALEIARAVPRGSQVLDIGCGNGYIAHHLTALLNAPVTGIDVAENTSALIPYSQFDGQTFPTADKAFDAALLCYVLHHAQDLKPIFSELRRTLRADGLLVVYEDSPDSVWDRIICGIHDRKWRRRTGPCTFRREREWRDTFAAEGFELCSTRPLSRWRKIVHPVSRRFFVLRVK